MFTITKVQLHVSAIIVGHLQVVHEELINKLYQRVWGVYSLWGGVGASTRAVERQLNAPAAFTPGEIPGTHFQRLSRTHGAHGSVGRTTEKIPGDTTGNRSRDRLTSSTVP